MATLGSASTLAQIQAEYDDCASYAEDRSADKARRFVTACRLLVRRMPKASNTREGGLQLNPEMVQREMQSAIDWLQANDTGGGPAGGPPRVTSVDFRNFR